MFNSVIEMKRKGIISILTLMLIVVSIGSVLAFGDGLFVRDSENRDKIIKAIEEKDYYTWKEVMSAQLTEENFNMLTKRHENMLERQAQREAIETALQKGDYQAWKEAMETIKSEVILNEDDFNILVQIHRARENGDYETVKELSEQLGPFENLHQRFPGHHMLCRGERMS